MKSLSGHDQNFEFLATDVLKKTKEHLTNYKFQSFQKTGCRFLKFCVRELSFVRNQN